MERKRYSITIQIFLSGELQEAVALTGHRLQQEYPQHRYMPKQDLHCTIRHVGDRDTPPNEDEITIWKKQIESVCNATLPFTLEGQEVKSFPNVLYVAITSPENRLQQLHQELLEILPSYHAQFEGSNYMPHSTICRYTEDPKDILSQVPRIPLGSCSVTTIQLMQWDLEKEQDHRVLAECTLKLS